MDLNLLFLFWKNCLKGLAEASCRLLILLSCVLSITHWSGCGLAHLVVCFVHRLILKAGVAEKHATCEQWLKQSCPSGAGKWMASAKEAKTGGMSIAFGAADCGVYE